jgi:hypothetical protein
MKDAKKKLMLKISRMDPNSVEFEQISRIAYAFNELPFENKVSIASRIVCKHRNVTMKELLTTSRKREHVYARFILFNLFRVYLEMPLTKIGQCFRRDHSTVIAGLDAFDSIIEVDQEFADSYEAIRDEFLKIIDGKVRDRVNERVKNMAKEQAEAARLALEREQKKNPFIDRFGQFEMQKARLQREKRTNKSSVR